MLHIVSRLERDRKCGCYVLLSLNVQYFYSDIDSYIYTLFIHSLFMYNVHYTVCTATMYVLYDQHACRKKSFRHFIPTSFVDARTCIEFR